MASQARSGSTSKRPRQDDDDITVIDPNDSGDTLGSTEDCICLIIKGKAKENILQYLQAINNKATVENERKSLLKSEETDKWKATHKSTCNDLYTNMRRYSEEEMREQLTNSEFAEFKSIRSTLIAFSISGDKTFKMLETRQKGNPYVMQVKTELRPNRFDKSTTDEIIKKLDDKVMELDNEFCKLTFDNAAKITKEVSEDMVPICQIDNTKSCIIARAWRAVCIRFRGGYKRQYPLKKPQGQQYHPVHNVQFTRKRNFNVANGTDKPKTTDRRQFRQTNYGERPPQKYNNRQYQRQNPYDSHHRDSYRHDSYRHDSYSEDYAEPEPERRNYWHTNNYNPDPYYNSHRYHRNFPRFHTDDESDTDDVFHQEY